MSLIRTSRRPLMGLEPPSRRNGIAANINHFASIFFLKFLADTCPFGGEGGHWYPVLDFWLRLLWVSKPEWVLPHSLFAEANVMYIPQDPHLVLHMLTSWQQESQPVSSQHASAEVGLGSDLNGQSPAQKINALPLCQRPLFQSSCGRDRFDRFGPNSIDSTNRFKEIELAACKHLLGVAKDIESLLANYNRVCAIPNIIEKLV